MLGVHLPKELDNMFNEKYILCILTNYFSLRYIAISGKKVLECYENNRYELYSYQDNIYQLRKDSRYIVTTDQKTIKVYDILGKREMASLEISGLKYFYFFRRKILYFDVYQVLRIWDFINNEDVEVMATEDKRITECLLRDNELFIVGFPGYLTILDWNTLKVLRQGSFKPYRYKINRAFLNGDNLFYYIKGKLTGLNIHTFVVDLNPIPLPLSSTQREENEKRKKAVISKDGQLIVTLNSGEVRTFETKDIPHQHGSKVYFRLNNVLVYLNLSTGVTVESQPFDEGLYCYFILSSTLRYRS
jgi:hypothetical protein